MIRETLISLNEVHAGYGRAPILQDVTTKISRGDRVAVLGRNGAGKSTLLKTIMGRTRLLSGQITMREVDISRMAIQRRVGLGIGLVPQTLELFSNLTVSENLRAIRSPGAIVEDAYNMFPRLGERATSLVEGLTREEQHMVAIARAMMMRPELLLLDEPLEGIAPWVCDIIMGVIAELADDGRTTVVMVAQHVDIALSFASHALLIDNGRIVFDGTSEALADRQDLLARYVDGL